MFGFLGIGAQKAGTTWLFTQLERHPELSFPLGKEVHFWNNSYDRSSIARYLHRFAQDPGCAGEITPAYAILAREGIAELHRHAPRLRLIFLVRNPAQRAWSSALMAVRRAEMMPEEASDQWFIDHFRSAGSLARGDYARCLGNWWSVYRPEQLLVGRFEAIRSDPARLLNRCFAHLGVRARPAVELAREGLDRAVFPGPKVPLRPSLRPVLAELYRPRIRALEDLLGEDLGDWLASLD